MCNLYANDKDQISSLKQKKLKKQKPKHNFHFNILGRRTFNSEHILIYEGWEEGLLSFKAIK